MAYAKMYTALAAVIRNFGDRMELYETTKDNIEFYYDHFVPAPKDQESGVRVLIKGVKA